MKTELQIHEAKLPELKGETDKYTINIGDFKTSLSIINQQEYRRTKQHNQPTTSKLYLQSTPSNNNKINICFNFHGIFTKLDNTLGHKTKIFLGEATSG